MKNNAPDNIVLLLTGTININNKHFTALTNPEKRRQEYIATIKYYLSHYNFPIVFSENSGEDLSAFFTEEINGGKLEILHFNGNDYDPAIGKGLGEMSCIEYAINNSVLITEKSFIFKITGRYIIVNFARFLNEYIKTPHLDLIADLTNNFIFSSAATFGFRPFFAKKYLFRHTHLINDTKGFYFEHALAKAVLEAIGDHLNFQIFKHYPKIKAISGTTGKAYKKSFLYLLPRHLKYWIRYLIVIR